MYGDFKTLLTSREGPIVRLCLDMPETGNAVIGTMLDEMHAVLTAVADDPGVRVLVLSGSGGDFCLGGDRSEFAELLERDPDGVGIRVLGGKARRVCEALAGCPAVTIARLQGGVIGAGLGLAVFCDLRVGADTSRYRLPELALGLPALWGGALSRLVSEVGPARVRELVLTGATFDAVRAQEIAVLHRVVPEAELDDAVAGWARPIVRRSPAALRVTKSAFAAYAGSARLADATVLDGDLMSAVIAARHAGSR
ncbi:enoyl-CoA hydratase/isomerase family protein [Streptomyces bohaiensis]|uniref:Enoyl-CoA hydratase/isomerase family protein n=1 Tax=Streptomyces bohaiensis TaxID=1431344 RepID=A0ABX1CEF2_9ACTN|nr:enoyl-CoA hydratase/isomerase family protein [Streptomyces bohaiensis]NJQ15777.1 enoyl-CoA hydratase/isomerase family protein [Streptomyces bohaiensis]